MTSAKGIAALASLARRGTLLAFICAILLALPALNSPLLEDDVVHRAMLRDRSSGVHWGPLDLYDFVGAPSRPASLLREQGLMPWFTAENLKIRFFRPISSAALAADAMLFGDHVWASRLHSLLWFLGVVSLTAVLHRRFLSPITAGLATLVYAVSVGHAMPVSWIAARYGLICTALSLATFWLHVRAREDGWKAARWLALSSFAAGLLAGEMTLGTVGLIGSWELFGRRDAIRQRISALIPFAALAAVYVACYATLGYGVRSSGAYIGPDMGAAAATAVLRHFFILIGELVAATPSDGVGVGAPIAQTIAAVWGAAMAAAAWAVLRFSRAHVDSHELAAMRWMPAAAAAAALPGAFAIVGGRVLTLALVPASGVVAVLLVAGASAAYDGAGSRAVRCGVAVAIVVLAFAHLVAAPILRVAIGEFLTRVAIEQREQAAQAPSCTGVMVIVAAADPTIATYVPATMSLEGHQFGRLRVLSMARSDHRIENVTRTGFDLVTPERDRTRSIWERLYRSAPLTAGTRVSLSSLDATVIEDTDGAPTRVRFDFGEPLDSPHLCFVQWRDGKIRPLPPPRPGQTVDLLHQPGPMGF